MTAPQRRQTDSAKNTHRITKAERRQQLIQLARQLFTSKSYEAVTLAELAVLAGIKDAILAKYYTDKATLFADVLAQIKIDSLDRLSASTSDQADPLSRVQAIAENCLQTVRRNKGDWKLIYRALGDAESAEVASALQNFFLEAETMLARIITEGQQSGVFRRSIEPRVGAWELIRSALGFAFVYPIGIPLHTETDYLPRAIECLLHCLVKTDV